MINYYLLRFILILFTISFCLLLTTSSAQPAYLMSLENGSRVNDTIVEFEVHLKSTSTPFVLTSYQCVFTINNEVINGGNISFSYVPGSSQLNNIPSYGIGINNHDNQLKLTFVSLAGYDSIFSSSIRVGKFRLCNSAPFSGLGLTVVWNFSGVINSILTGSYFMNITNPVNHSNLYFSWDITPPVLQNVTILDSTNLMIDFSETLDTTTVKTLSNYSITNGINILSASAISPWNKIALTTSPHNLGNSYSLSVQNIWDLFGNVITGSGGTANYSYGETLKLALKIFLQGPFKNGLMKTTLNDLQFIPKNQPFNVSPWNYHGLENVTTIPQDVIDWILVELRTGLNAVTTVIKRAAFLKLNGSIVDVDDSTHLRFPGFPGLYYVVVNHRNHLGVISSDRINLTSIPSLYDFTTSMNSAYGTNSLFHLGNGLYGLFAGDGNGNGNINNADLNTIWKKQNGKMGYKAGDFDLNGGVNIVDKNYYWMINKGNTTNIPTE